MKPGWAVTLMVIEYAMRWLISVRLRGAARAQLIAILDHQHRHELKESSQVPIENLLFTRQSVHPVAWRFLKCDGHSVTVRLCFNYLLLTLNGSVQSAHALQHFIKVTLERKKDYSKLPGKTSYVHDITDVNDNDLSQNIHRWHHAVSQKHDSALDSADRCLKSVIHGPVKCSPSLRVMSALAATGFYHYHVRVIYTVSPCPEKRCHFSFCHNFAKS